MGGAGLFLRQPAASIRKFAPQPITEGIAAHQAIGPPKRTGMRSPRVAGIELCRALRHRKHGLNAISPEMPTNLYGPGDNYHPTTAMCCRP